MANFRTHTSFSVVLAVATVVAGLIFSLIYSPLVALGIFLVVIFGSFLPDLDLDDGMPFQIFFGLIGLAFSALAFLIFFQDGQRDWRILAGIVLGVFVLFRFVLGYFFMKLTSHRGMFHSIPVAMLFGLILIKAIRLVGVGMVEALLYSLGLVIGYLGHLILDEIYSTVGFHGLISGPKKSLGSALKFFSHSMLINLIVYGSIIILAWQIF